MKHESIQRITFYYRITDVDAGIHKVKICRHVVVGDNNH